MDFKAADTDSTDEKTANKERLQPLSLLSTVSKPQGGKYPRRGWGSRPVTETNRTGDHRVLREDRGHAASP